MKLSYRERLAQRAAEAFSKLLRSTAYSPNIPASTKQELVQYVWETSAVKLQQEYDESGISFDKQTQGFGFLVEAFARVSSSVPQNTPIAQQLSELLLNELSSGGVLTSLGRSLRNPDRLFITLTGRRAEVWGLGEIKSSVQAHRHRPNQIYDFESALRILSRAIDAGKSSGTINKFMLMRKIIVASPLKKMMIVPNGQGLAMKKALPYDWDVIQIEFTYEELTFLAQQLWPKFHPDIVFDHNFLGRFETEFLQQLADWGWSILGSVFHRHPDFPILEVLLFSTLTNKLPLTPVDVAWVKELVSQSMMAKIWEEQDPQSVGRPVSTSESLLAQKLRESTGADEKFIWFFLSGLANIGAQISDDVVKHQERISAMPDLDLLQL